MKMKFPSNISIASYEFKNIVEFPTNGQTRLKGTDGRLLDVLSEALKFNYTLVDPLDYQDGTMLEDGNWTGLIRMILSGEADIAIGFLPITEIRSQVIDFSALYAESFNTFATNLPETLPSIYSYWYTFDIPTWIGLIIILLTLPIAIVLLSDGKHSYIDILLKLFGNAIRQPLDEKIGGCKYIKVSWWFFTFVVSFSYIAALASFLSVPLQEKPIESFEQLDDAIRHKGYKVFSVRGSHFLSYFYLSKIPLLMHIAETVDVNDWYVNWNDLWNTSTFKPKTVYFVEKVSAELWYGKKPFASKHIPDNTYISCHVALMVSKSFCCKKELDSVIVKVFEAGLYEKYLKEEQYKTWLQFSKSVSHSNQVRQLSLSNISGAFVILLVGYCVSTTVLAVEIAFAKIRIKPAVLKLGGAPKM